MMQVVSGIIPFHTTDRAIKVTRTIVDIWTAFKTSGVRVWNV
jgi:hypothetical protein